tara:strand:- start:84 stop:1253 length:1170 start_codon:yes stop_codon:yes gene_type:complete
MKLKVIHISTESFTAFKFIVPLLNVIDKSSNYDLSIGCNTNSFSDAKSYYNELIKSNFQIHHLPIERDITPFKDFLSIIKMALFIRRNNFSVVHTHNSKAGIIVRISAWLAQIPIIFHTAYDYRPLSESNGTMKGWLLKCLEKFTNSISEHIFYIHNDGLNLGQKYKIADINKVSNVGVGISFKEFDRRKIKEEDRVQLIEKLNIDKGKFIVGSLSRLVPHKGVDVLLKAVPLVLKEFSNVHFLFLGGGPQQTELVKISENLGINDSVTFSGFVKDQKGVPLLYSIMDIFWMATKYEGFGLTYTEANAMGVPVVGSNISPVDFVIGDNIGGLLADPYSARSFADSCIRLLQNPELCDRLAKQGFERGKRLFDENLTYERIYKVYNRILK